MWEGGEGILGSKGGDRVLYQVCGAGGCLNIFLSGEEEVSPPSSEPFATHDGTVVPYSFGSLCRTVLIRFRLCTVPYGSGSLCGSIRFPSLTNIINVGGPTLIMVIKLTQLVPPPYEACVSHSVDVVYSPLRNWCPPLHKLCHNPGKLVSPPINLRPPCES